MNKIKKSEAGLFHRHQQSISQHSCDLGWRYQQDPAFRKKFGPRGMIKSRVDGRIEDTGPLTRKRMETVDEETLAGAARVLGETFSMNIAEVSKTGGFELAREQIASQRRKSTEAD